MYRDIVSIAPMMGWTDRHARYFLRLITRRTLLYTEMVTTGAVLHGNQKALLNFHKDEHPLALQLGGSDPDELARCSIIAEEMGYDQVNLNVGCPSDRVKQGSFGACLMAKPFLVADCISAIRSSISIPVSVKCRIGIDDMDSYPELVQFILTVAGSGCNNFIIHARKAWLQGLSPKQNREVPPLKYEYVYRLKQEFPEFTVVLNGGVKSHEEMHLHLNYVDGVMLGREAYHNPYLLSGVDQIFYEENARSPSREQLVHSIIPYIEQELMAGTKLHSITRHLHGLFLGCPGARTWRRYISQHDYQPDADASILLAALEKMAHPASQAVI